MVEDGGGIVCLHRPPPSSTDLHRPQVPPCQLRSVRHHQLDPLPIGDAEALRVRHRGAWSWEREPLLKQPREDDERDIGEGEAERDSEDEHGEKLMQGGAASVR